MRKTLMLAAALVAAGAGGAVAQGSPEELSVQDRLATYMATAAEEGFIGAVIVARGDETLLAGGYGTLSAAGDAPVTVDSVSTMGSITKQFTAAAIVKLAAEGRVSTDDRLGDFFEDVPEDKAAITIHHLLSHQAGFPGAIGFDGKRIGRDAFVADALATDLLFEPGTAYEYSNVGYSLAAAIVELVSGQRYEDYLATHLFGPAGMKHTGYNRPDWDLDTFAVGREPDGSDWGTVYDMAIVEGGPGWHLLGNGGLHTTAPDMLAWHRALRDGTVLPKDAEQRMYGHYAEEGGGAWYGYGWSLQPTRWGEELITHNGGNPYYFADFLRFPESDLAIYLWTVSPDRRMQGIARPLAEIVFDGEAPPFPDPPAPLELAGEPDPDGATLPARWGLPPTMIGLRAAQLAELLMGADESTKATLIEAAFGDGVIERNTVEGLQELFARVRDDLTPTELKGFRMLGPDELGVVFDSMQGETTLLAPLGPEPERQITGLGVEVN